MLLLRLQGEGTPAVLVLTATLGNLLGQPADLWPGATSQRGDVRALPAHRLRRHGACRGLFGPWGRPALLLAWLRVVGDGLCLVAGLLRVGLTSFVLLVGLGKLARCAFLAGLSV